MKDVTIYMGGVHASDEPAVIKTLLGSCVATCLWDPVRHVGGMNHFMLPHGETAGGEASRFGVHAMDCLIGAMMKLGADRRRCVAKIFGGAHVLDVRESEHGVPRQNIAFARHFLDEEGFPILAEDLGGYKARQVHFDTVTGRVRVRRLDGAGTRVRVVRRETVPAPAPAYGDVALWD